MVLRVRVQGAADDVDTCEAVDGLSLVKSLQVYVVETVLSVEPINHTSFDRLYNNYRTVEVCLLVHVVNNPINESAQEVSFTKLDDFLRHYAFGRSPFV